MVYSGMYVYMQLPKRVKLCILYFFHRILKCYEFIMRSLYVCVRKVVPAVHLKIHLEN